MALGVVLVGVLGLLVALFIFRDLPGEQSVDEALEEFRGDGADDRGPDDGLPPAGVYRSTGEGEAALASLGLSQQDGPEVPITVTHEGDGCWSLEMSLNEDHRQINHLCLQDDGTIVEMTGETEQRWDLGAVDQTNHTEFICDPPAVVVDPSAEPGDSWPQACTGTNTGVEGSTRSAGPYTYVGEEQLEVGGEAVATYHYRQERTISGSQEGDQVVDHWYTVDSGLLVREERRSEVSSDSPVGAIAYTEEGSWQLTSLEPET